MRIAVIGSGGREHAILWKLCKDDPSCKLFAIPGNGGTNGIAENIAADLANIQSLVQFLVSLQLDLVIVGPEALLAEGITDQLTKVGIPCFGPSAQAARLETSKAYSKEFMRKNNLPTADYKIFSDYSELEEYVKKEPYGNGWVVKADGLAAGKGAIVCSSIDEVLQSSRAMLVDNVFGGAGKTVVLERKLAGREASALFLCDGQHFITLPPAQDYKRAGNKDTGLNTGGMGTFCPASHLTNELLQEIEQRIVSPILIAMAKEGYPYRGVLYVGLMLTAEGLKIIEFNCRFGDPETQVILPIWQGHLAQTLLACALGNLGFHNEYVKPTSSAVCVVLAAEGYPASYPNGIELREIDNTETAYTLHAGTIRHTGKLVSNGGRVLNAIGIGETKEKARQHAYTQAQQLLVPGLRFRSDIAE